MIIDPKALRRFKTIAAALPSRDGQLIKRHRKLKGLHAVVAR